MINNIEQKQDQLKNINKILKSRYFGIDHIIDKITDFIETWFIYDEILYKPTILNLFGLTGCGKSGIVKDVVKLLGMYEKFVEIDLSKPTQDQGKFSFYQGGPITNKIYSMINDTDDKAIILVDEIQKIKENHQYSELWSLLADGRLGNGHIALNKIDNFINSSSSIIENYQDSVSEMEYMKKGAGDTSHQSFNYNWNPLKQPIQLSRRYLINNLYEAVKIKNIDDIQPLFDFHDFSGNNTGFVFGFKNIAKRMIESGEKTIKDIIELPGFAYVQPLIEIAKNYRKILIERYNKVSSRDPLVFSKLLIFVTGNVDGLYSDVSKDINISADELHEKTLKLSINNLKDELLKIFKPDEVGRLGGNFIIYPSLSLKAFRSIIIEKIKQVEIDISEVSGIEIKLLTDNYLKYLEKTCIVASLGARPLISNLYTEINNIVPKLVKEAKIKGLKSISISYLKNNFN